jgi:hypothetical protein
MKKAKGKTSKSKLLSDDLKKKGATKDESLNTSSDGVLGDESGETIAAFRAKS